MTDPLPLHVAVAVVINNEGKVLISHRSPHVHQGGLWEFPGGKVESGEDVVQTLERELKEEVGIEIERARPLIKIRHAYPDQEILLDVWRVERWHGEPQGCEGQAIAWADPVHLLDEDFPKADRPIVASLKLPPLYLISPEPGSDLCTFHNKLKICIEAGVCLFQLRAKEMSEQRFKWLTREALKICEPFGADVLLNTDPVQAVEWGAQGVHLTSHRLFEHSRRPLGKPYWVAASCHNALEVEQAMRIEADFVVISPVHETRSHPMASPLGWDGFAQLVERSKAPVFALGGLKPAHMGLAWSHGGQGLAMISGIWDAEDPAEAVRRTYATIICNGILK